MSWRMYFAVIVLALAIPVFGCGSKEGGGGTPKDVLTGKDAAQDLQGADVEEGEAVPQDAGMEGETVPQDAGTKDVEGDERAVEEVAQEATLECDPPCGEGFECKDGQCVKVEPPPDEFQILISYLEGEGGDYMNTKAPKVIDAVEVMSEGLDTWKILDIREADKYGPDENGEWKLAPNGIPDYYDGHIEGAVFVPLKDIVAYAQENLDKADQVLVVSHTGHDAGHAVLALNLLGYDAYSLNWGMSSWNAVFDLWSDKVGSAYVEEFVKDPDTGKNEAGPYPVLNTGLKTGPEILLARIEELLSGKPKVVEAKDVLAAPENYYIVNYWPENHYLEVGHLPTAHLYVPKESLKTSADLSTLPVDQKIVVYCYSGQVGSQVAAFLTILGYEAYDLEYGTNGLIYDIMTEKKWPGPEKGPAGYDYVSSEPPKSE